MTSLRSPLGRVRGLGSAKEGVHHWWMQRVTAVALVPLLLWFVVSICAMIGADYEQARGWVAHPAVSVLLILLIGAGFHHMQLGLQVVLEDYVQTGWLRVASILTVKLVTIVLGIVAVLSVIRIAVDG